jgi:uncharacterized protein YbjT (DUF2867 family)
MTQRVVIVGATGQIGQPLCAGLIRAGHAVVVFSRDPDRARQLVPPDRATALGYEFSYPGLDEALHDLLGQPVSTAGAGR